MACLKTRKMKKKEICVYFLLLTLCLCVAIFYILYCGAHSLPVSLCGIIAFAISAFASARLYLNKKNIFGNVFLITWELSFFISLFKLSKKQFVYDESICLYFLVIGIIPLCIDMFVGRKYKGISVKKRLNRSSVCPNMRTFAYVFFALAIVFFVLTVKTFGIYAIEGERVNISGNGSWVNVACNVFTRVSFYIASFILINNQDKYSIPILMWAPVYSLLIMSRSLLISLAVFFLITLFLYEKIKFFRALIIGVVLVFAFGFLGDLREGSNFAISKYAEMKTNSTLSWLYSYVCVNFDNLALQILKGTPSNTLSYTLSPLITLLDLDFTWFNIKYIYVGGLNLGTFFRDYVCDAGSYALIPFSITIYILIRIIYNAHADGYITTLKIVLLSEIALAPITNHFTQSPIWLVMLMLIGLRLVDKEKRKVSTNSPEHVYKAVV